MGEGLLAPLQHFSDIIVGPSTRRRNISGKRESGVSLVLHRPSLSREFPGALE